MLGRVCYSKYGFTFCVVSGDLGNWAVVSSAGWRSEHWMGNVLGDRNLKLVSVVFACADK